MILGSAVSVASLRERREDCLSRIDMAYYDEYTKDDEAKVKGVWLKGHQDHGGEYFARLLTLHSRS